MMIPSEETSPDRPLPQAPSDRYPVKHDRRRKPRISPSERWQLISEKVSERVQQRGFVGGDALEDLSEAALALDEKYATDIYGLLSLTETEELLEQFRKLFAGYGLGRHSLARLIDMNRETLEALAETNARLTNNRPDRVARGAPLLSKAINHAISNLGTFLREEPLDEPAPLLAERENRAIRKALRRLRELEATVSRLTGQRKAGKDHRAGSRPLSGSVCSAVVKGYQGYSAGELSAAPVAALKGISARKAEMLASRLAMHTISDMAQFRPVKMAMAVAAFANARSGAPGSRPGGALPAEARSLADIAAEPAEDLEGLTGEQAGVLWEVFRIKTVRDLAENRYFLTAGAIVMLADLEN